ncbi:MAG: hypothetical protein IKJ24_02855 [Clostridia bacterium]|nr:hypothetical protein [Clostridia bacterium]
MSRRDNNSPKKQLKDISPDTIKRVAILVLNTLILTVIYFGTMGLNEPLLSFIVTAGYWLAFAGFTIGYIMYNRGFLQKGITTEMLPDSWDAAKKTEFIENVAARSKRSRWMLSVIIPIMIPIALDAIYLFSWPIVQNLFNIK